MSLKKYTFLLLLITLFSCTEEQGNKVTGGNLAVYYVDVKDEALAEDLALFWKNNDLLTEEQQDIQISRHKKGYHVSLIAREPKKVKDMSFSEQKALFDLQEMIRDSVFKEKNVDLIISDNQFKPILNINK